MKKQLSKKEQIKALEAKLEQALDFHDSLGSIDSAEYKKHGDKSLAKIDRIEAKLEKLQGGSFFSKLAHFVASLIRG